MDVNFNFNFRFNPLQMAIATLVFLPLSVWGNYNVYPHNLVPTLDGQPDGTYLPGALAYTFAAAKSVWIWEDYLKPVLKYKDVSIGAISINLVITSVFFIFLKGIFSGFYYLWV